MFDLILIAGAPGSGKTTIARILEKKLGSVVIEFSNLRQPHLKPDWSDESEEEEAAAFEELVAVLREHVERGDENVIVTDLKDERVRQFPDLFADCRVLIATLVLRDDEELRRRVALPERDSGFRDEEAAIAWNRAILARGKLKGEKKIDNTARKPDKAVKRILALVGVKG